MGEVYRADDLKLGQAVALKFLRQSLANDPVKRERFFAEVRIARQLSHPNVCRVYDIAEYQGLHFLSMEYIDGEDLSSLLRRIGHLPNEKALDISRQLAAGLAAAHERGVLHRDLKPANVMLDGRGRVRITDFGLAVAAEDIVPAGVVSGTPAYMSPEQLEGKPATLRSDIYALGLTMYEIYTGKRAFKGASFDELRAEKETVTPTAPSERRPGVDPGIERLIMRCLERDPRLRPDSVTQLALALPGGDVLAAAIAAGETPSPELLRAAGSKEGLRAPVAAGLLGLAMLGMLAAVMMHDSVGMVQLAKVDKPPDALVERARETIARLGYSAPARDTAYGFFADGDALAYLSDRGTVANPTDHLVASGAVGFFYRESPTPLLGLDILGGLTPDNPPPVKPGEIVVQMDGQGRLRGLKIVPPRENLTITTSPPVWSSLFAQAGLDAERWTRVAPQWTPPYFADTQAAWTGALPDAPNVPVRIEAAGYAGKPVLFTIVGPWTEPVGKRGFATGVRPPNAPASFAALAILFIVLGTSGVVLARRNLRAGRGDRRAASRLMLLVFGAMTIAWGATTHHVAALGELQLFASFLGVQTPMAVLLWVFYISVEPFVRRRWPQMLVSWTRLLSGDWQDPLVGRDILIGSAAGVAASCLMLLERVARPLSGLAAPLPLAPNWNFLNSGVSFVGALFYHAGSAFLLALMILVLLLVLRAIFRSDWIAAAMLALVLAFGGRYMQSLAGVSEQFWVTLLLAPLFSALVVFIVMRAGLVATATFVFVVSLFRYAPLTAHASAWYARVGYGCVVLIAALTIYGFRTAVGGRSLVGAIDLDD
jgi:serine/threonine-protein kinase